MEAKYLTSAEVARLRAVMDDETWLVFWVMLETGLRVGDAVALTRKNLRGDRIYYRAQKTGKRGSAAISPDLMKALKARGDGYLFKGRKNDTHLTRQAVWKRIKRACERALLSGEGVSPHAMRKVFAVETFRERGMEATREALQHGSRDTTEIYAFSDWNTGEKKDIPLTRGDLKTIVGLVVKALSYHDKK